MEDFVGPDFVLRMCSCGSYDVGASNGIASCYRCKEYVQCETTDLAVIRWNETRENAKKKEKSKL